MEFPLEIVVEEHAGLSLGFGQWHLVAKRGEQRVGVYYIHFGIKEDRSVYIHDSKLVSGFPRQHIPRFLIQQCSLFLAGKAKELHQSITHTVKINNEEIRYKLRPIFEENGYTYQGLSRDLRGDLVMSHTYQKGDNTQQI